MKKNLISSLVLVVILGAMAAWYFGYEKNIRVSQQKEEEQGKKLTSLSKDEIFEIKIDRMEKVDKKDLKSETAQTILLRKINDKWHLIEPVEDHADVSTLNTLLSTLENTKHERVIDEDPKDLSIFGLKEPAVTVTLLSAPNAEPRFIRIGNDTPVGYSLYAIGDSSGHVVRVARSVRSSLAKSLKDLRNKRVFAGLSRRDITSIEIRSGKDRTILNQSGEKGWEVANQGLPADKSEVNKTLNAVINLRAIEFAAESPKSLAPFGLTRPHLKIEFTKKDKTRLALNIGKANKKVYAQVPSKGTVYELKASVLDKVHAAPSKYYDLGLATFNRFDVKRIVLKTKEQLEFTKTGEKWALADSPNIDSAKVDELLTHLQDTKAIRFVGKPSSSMGFDNPRLSIQIFGKDESKPDVELTFGSKRQKSLYVKRTGFSRAMLLSLEEFNKIKTTREAYLKVDKPKADKKKES